MTVKQNRLTHLEHMLEARVGCAHDVLVARGELESARIAQRAARSRLSALRVGLIGDSATYQILAPADGTILALDARIGAIVGPDAPAVAVVASLDEVFAVADVPLLLAKDLRPGISATVRADQASELRVQGRIDDVADVVRPDLQTVSVRLRVSNRQRQLLANAFVHIEFDASEHDVVRIPSVALVSDGSMSVVFVETAPRHYERRLVELGWRSGPWAEIRSGLSIGERVVVERPSLLLNMIDG